MMCLVRVSINNLYDKDANTRVEEELKKQHIGWLKIDSR